MLDRVCRDNLLAIVGQSMNRWMRSEAAAISHGKWWGRLVIDTRSSGVLPISASREKRWSRTMWRDSSRRHLGLDAAHTFLSKGVLKAAKQSMFRLHSLIASKLLLEVKTRPLGHPVCGVNFWILIHGCVPLVILYPKSYFASMYIYIWIVSKSTSQNYAFLRTPGCLVCPPNSRSDC